MSNKIVALAGGVGAARFLTGLASIKPQEEITVIINTGDDLTLHGLYISPDIDIITYTLAGVVDEQKGWGIAGDSFNCLSFLSHYTDQTWFNLGDRDLATHIYRTSLIKEGLTLSETTRRIAQALGVRAELLPMSDRSVPTKIISDEGKLDFQEYFVKRKTQLRVKQVIFEGAEEAEPAPGVIERINSAKAIIVCPSNPIISIGPILAIKGVRQALQQTVAPVAAISPIVGGRALKGPADRMLAELGLQASACQVAELYKDFIDLFILDQQDASQAEEIKLLGMKVVVTNTVMAGAREKTELARVALGALNL